MDAKLIDLTKKVMRYKPTREEDKLWIEALEQVQDAAYDYVEAELADLVTGGPVDCADQRASSYALGGGVKCGRDGIFFEPWRSKATEVVSARYQQHTLT